MEEQFSFYMKDGGTDKVYHAQLKSVGDNLFKVNVQHGRRLGNLKVDTKTPEPVDYDVAKKAFDKVKKEKLAKGYSPTEGGAAYQDTMLEKKFSGISPQLLNAIDEKSALACIESNRWVMQQKFDGERLLIKKVGNVITGINKKGIETPIAKEMETHFLKSSKDFCVDGEIVGEKFHMFDVLDYDGVSQKNTAYEKRLDLMSSVDVFNDVVIPTASSVEDKKALFKKIKEHNLEGVVFKRVDALYVGGRPASDGSYLKFKFLESATLVVKSKNKTKRSVLVVGYDKEDREYELGYITIPLNKDIPEVKAIIEVSYLYANNGGSLFQTVYKGERHDQDLSDCTIEQLKYKQENKVIKVCRP